MAIKCDICDDSDHVAGVECLDCCGVCGSIKDVSGSCSKKCFFKDFWDLPAISNGVPSQQDRKIHSVRYVLGLLFQSPKRAL
jgi:hypothetical protein